MLQPEAAAPPRPVDEVSQVALPPAHGVDAPQRVPKDHERPHGSRLTPKPKTVGGNLKPKPRGRPKGSKDNM